jgi:Ca2+-binding RTX toxin-like protein
MLKSPIRNLNKKEKIKLTKENDVVNLRHGNHLVNALDGDDVIRGGIGNNKIFSGKGDDFVKLRQGENLILGGKGDDTLKGGLINDTIRGGAGDDVIIDKHGKNIINGGSGDDLIITDGHFAKGSVIEGGSGDDTLQIYNSGNEIETGTGNDTIILNIENFTNKHTPSYLKDYNIGDKIIINFDNENYFDDLLPIPNTIFQSNTFSTTQENKIKREFLKIENNTIQMQNPMNEENINILFLPTEVDPNTIIINYR